MSSLNPEMRRWVEDRADRRCEYCGIPQEKEPFFRFHVDHIIARQHGGETTTTNLALACHFCNRHKGPNLSSIDPLTANIEALFNPRSDVWLDHFELAGDKVLGRTPTGRATVSLLRMNAPNRRALR